MLKLKEPKINHKLKALINLLDPVLPQSNTPSSQRLQLWQTLGCCSWKSSDNPLKICHSHLSSSNELKAQVLQRKITVSLEDLSFQ